MERKGLRLWAALLFGVLVSTAAWPDTLPLADIRLPPGFTIELVARVPNAREMTFGDDGTLYVGSMQAGRVTAVRDPLGAAPRVTVLARGLRLPVGVAFRHGALYVSAVDRILRFDDIGQRLDDPPQPVVVSAAFPNETHHGWKFIAFGPDGWLYVPVGAPCNICEPDPNRFAVIMRMRPDGSDLQVYARGVRNSVGFDWQPGSGVLWFTDNGRDWLGDNAPPDELDRAPRAGMNFGYPYCHGGTIPDPEFGAGHPCSEFVPPAQALGPHVAALGMRFYTGTQFPPEYRGNIFIAEHGSWNRAHKIGYRVVRVRVEGGRALGVEPFATGWLQGESAWGRPADVAVAPDGSLFVTDDSAGAIYRISYRRE